MLGRFVGLLLCLCCHVVAVSIPPPVLFGGSEEYIADQKEADRKGFVVRIDSGQPEFKETDSPVYALLCLAEGRVLISHGNHFHDHHNNKVSTKVLDETALALLPVPMSHGVAVLAAGLFDRGIIFWDKDEAIPVSKDGLTPPCVYAMADFGGPTRGVLVGGCFQRSGAVPLNNVALLVLRASDPESSRYAPVGSGVIPGSTEKSVVFALVSDNRGAQGSAYIGGTFEQTGTGVTVNNIARWIPERRDWGPLGMGVNGDVRALALGLPGKGVYVGGIFCSVEMPEACNLAAWSEGSGWRMLGRGVRGNVFSLLALDTKLFVGGKFEAIDTRVRDVAGWSMHAEHDAPSGWDIGMYPSWFHLGAVSTIAACPCPAHTYHLPSGGCELAHHGWFSGEVMIGVGVVLGIGVLGTLAYRRFHSRTLGYQELEVGEGGDDAVQLHEIQGSLEPSEPGYHSVDE